MRKRVIARSLRGVALHFRAPGPAELADILGSSAPHPRRHAPTGITPTPPHVVSVQYGTPNPANPAQAASTAVAQGGIPVFPRFSKTIGVGHAGNAARGKQALTHKDR